MTKAELLKDNQKLARAIIDLEYRAKIKKQYREKEIKQRDEKIEEDAETIKDLRENYSIVQSTIIEREDEAKKMNDRFYIVTTEKDIMADEFELTKNTLKALVKLVNNS